MSDTIQRAVEKINTNGSFITNRYASAIAEPVKKALRTFCEQQEEFARAVLDGGTISDCILHVAKQISGKHAVSDIDVYQSAAEFYFPGAVIEHSITIRMSRYELAPSAAPSAALSAAQQEPPKNMKLSLDSLLDW